MIGNDQDEKKLTAKQDAFIVALLSKPSLVAAARSIDVPEVTARRWFKLDHFQKAYRDAQQERFTDALSLLQTGVSVAIKALHKHMTNKDTPPAVQVRAAQIWLDQAISLHKMSELEQKIADLEEIVQERHR